MLCLLTRAQGSVDEDLQRAIQRQKQNDAKGARGEFERLLPLLRAGPDRAQLALLLQRLSESDWREGLASQAITRSTECAGINRQLKDFEGETTCRTITGGALSSQGRYTEAASEYQQALTVARQHKLPEAQIALLNNSGGMAYFEGRYDEAFRCYTEAEAMLPPYRAEPWFLRRQTVTLANLATLYQRLGQYENALRFYRQIGSLPGKLRGSEQGQVLENSGTLFRRLGDPYKALQVYEQARQLFQSAHDMPGEISVNKNTGIVLAFGLNNYRKASSYFEEAMHLATAARSQREVAQVQIYRAECLRRAGDSATSRTLFEEALSATQKAANGEDAWKALYGLAQIAEAESDISAAEAHYFRAIDTIEHLRVSAGPPALKTGFLADKRDVYNGAIRILLKQQPVPVARVFSLLEQAKARAFQDSLLAGGTPLSLIAVQAVLPVGTTLLDYWISENQLAVIWVTKQAYGLVQQKAPEPTAWSELLQQMARPQSDSWRKPAVALSNLVLPFDHFEGTNLVIIPDGELQRIPFDILSAPGSGGKRLLIEDYALSYLPAASLALLPHRGASGWFASWRGRWRAPWETMFVGFADPQAQSRNPEQDLYPPESASDLASSAKELETAARHLGGRSKLFAGPRNRKQELLLLPFHNLPVLHLATHAVADMDDADRSRILFSPLPDGAGHYLFLREIYGMKLHGTGLAILSACDTEQGAGFRGEGIQGFSRALLAAGVASTVTTLWRVGDLTGAAFSDHLYSHLTAGENISAALRAAKLEFYRSNRQAAHPFYWSVYVLNGDPQLTVPRNVPWTAILAAALFLVAIAINVRQRRPRRFRRPDPR